MPCLPLAGARAARLLATPCPTLAGIPVQARQTALAPSAFADCLRLREVDGRKVVSSTPRDMDPERAKRPACLTTTGPHGPPQYPTSALRREEQGTVVPARPRSAGPTQASVELAQRMRLPGLGTVPPRNTLVYRWITDGGSRAVLSDVGLVPFLREARNVPKARCGVVDP